MFLTFDLDRVLIQNPFALGVFPEVRRRLRPYVDRSMTGGTDPDLWIMRRIVGAAEDRARAGDYVGSYDWDAIVQGVAEELGCPERLDIEAMVHSYCRLPYIAAYGDVVPALETLRERADSLWWISNGFARYQLPVVEALGLEGYFDGYLRRSSTAPSNRRPSFSGRLLRRRGSRRRRVCTWVTGSQTM